MSLDSLGLTNDNSSAYMNEQSWWGACWVLSLGLPNVKAQHRWWAPIFLWGWQDISGKTSIWKVGWFKVHQNEHSWNFNELKDLSFIHIDFYSWDFEGVYTTSHVVWLYLMWSWQSWYIRTFLAFIYQFAFSQAQYWWSKLLVFTKNGIRITRSLECQIVAGLYCAFFSGQLVIFSI